MKFLNKTIFVLVMAGAMAGGSQLAAAPNDSWGSYLKKKAHGVAISYAPYAPSVLAALAMVYAVASDACLFDKDCLQKRTLSRTPLILAYMPVIMSLCTGKAQERFAEEVEAGEATKANKNMFSGEIKLTPVELLSLYATVARYGASRLINVTKERCKSFWDKRPAFLKRRVS